MADKKYVYIDVVDTAQLCGLDIKPGTLGNREVQARCPYCGDYKYRMYLSRQPENPPFGVTTAAPAATRSRCMPTSIQDTGV